MLISTTFRFSMLTNSFTSLSCFSAFKSNLSINLLKLSSLNFANSFSLSQSFSFKSSTFSVRGTSTLIVPSVLDSRAKSLFSISFSLVFAFTSSVLLSIAS